MACPVSWIEIRMHYRVYQKKEKSGKAENMYKDKRHPHKPKIGRLYWSNWREETPSDTVSYRQFQQVMGKGEENSYATKNGKKARFYVVLNQVWHFSIVKVLQSSTFSTDIAHAISQKKLNETC